MKRIVVAILFLLLCTLVSCDSIFYSCEDIENTKCSDGKFAQGCKSRFSESGYFKINGQKLEFANKKEAAALILAAAVKCGINFEDDSDWIFKDDLSNLTWSKKFSPKDWADAMDYCKNLNYAGQNDWRLPNIDELRTINGNLEIMCGSKAGEKEEL